MAPLPSAQFSAASNCRRRRGPGGPRACHPSGRSAWQAGPGRHRAHRAQPHASMEAAASFGRGRQQDPSEHQLNYLAQAHWHHFRYHFGEMIGLDRRRRRFGSGPTHDEESREIAAPLRHPLRYARHRDRQRDQRFRHARRGGIRGSAGAAEQAVRFHHRLVNAGLRAQAQSEPLRPASCMSPSSARARPAPNSPPNFTRAPGRCWPTASTRSIRTGISASSWSRGPSRISARAARADPRRHSQDPDRHGRLGPHQCACLRDSRGRHRARERRVHPGRTHRLGGRGEGPGRARPSRRPRGQPGGPARDRGDACDHPRRRHLRHRRLRGRPPRRLRGARSAARPGRPPEASTSPGN